MKRGRDASKHGPDRGSIARRTLLPPPPPTPQHSVTCYSGAELNLKQQRLIDRKKEKSNSQGFSPSPSLFWDQFPFALSMFDLRPRAAAPSPALYSTGQLGWSGAPPDRSITKPAQSAVWDRIHANKPLTIHYREAGQGEDRPAAAC